VNSSCKNLLSANTAKQQKSPHQNYPNLGGDFKSKEY